MNVSRSWKENSEGMTRTLRISRSPLNCCHERVASTEKKIVDIETTLNDSSLKSVQSELDGVKKVVFETQRQVNDLEQYGRRSNIRIFGLETRENDNYVEKVTSFLVDRLSMNLDSTDVENAHPLPVRRGSTSAKVSIIVRFKSRRIKA